MPTRKIRLGVSSCLLGSEVRYDGQHKRDPYLVEVLGPFVEWVPVCPELELGLGVPREPIRLVGEPRAPRLLGEHSGANHTAAMRRFAARRVAELEALALDGYVTKQGSPSCGMERVRVHPEKKGPPRRDGVGMFARALTERMPLLPVEEEGRLEDPAVRDSFVERIFAYARWKAARAAGMRRADLVAFHAAHELAIRAHSPAAHRRLAALVAPRRSGPIAPVVDAYGRGFMAALQIPATRGRHASVLRRVACCFRDVLRAPERRELDALVQDYARGRVPLVVPLTLMRHHVRKHGVEPLAGQKYLDPDPEELMLRNHS
jgi:uncharacterized protein YbbK (DUF523 family)/uncharacterized protein YbgA (DUF1722 family)